MSRQALLLRIQGRTITDISRIVGYKNPSTCSAGILRALNRTLQEPADKLRQIELERLDAMTSYLWPYVMAGDTNAIGKVVRLMERRAKLIGLDAPTTISIPQLPPPSPSAVLPQLDLSSVPEEVLAAFLAASDRLMELAKPLQPSAPSAPSAPGAS